MAALNLALVAAAWLPPRLSPPHLPAALLPSLSAPLAASASENIGGVDLVTKCIEEKMADFDWNFGTLYALFCLVVYASIALQGKSGVMMRNGTVYRDGVEVVQPFKQSAEEAASAAAAAAQAETGKEQKEEEKRGS